MCYSLRVPNVELGILSFSFSENIDIHFVMISMSVGSDDVDVDCVTRFQFEMYLRTRNNTAFKTHAKTRETLTDPARSE